MTTHPTTETPPTRRPLREFIHDEVAGGALLLAATVAALVWANAHPDSYDGVWSTVVGPSSPLHLDLSLGAWVNDGLMALFFFVVGLEIKRELVTGELANPRDAAMPVLAALGGMAVPALVFVAVTAGTDGADGWGIPMATDIAFVLGVLAVLGSRVPPGLRLFLLAVAIVDDLGAIVVIAIFYSEGLEPAFLLASVAVVAAVVVMRRLDVKTPWAYLVPAVALWAFVHESGVHATLAGVALGLLTPARPVGGRPILDDLQDRLHPVSALLVVPLFALANAGVVVRGDTVTDAASSQVAWGVVLGLVVGKPVGISLAALAARRARVGSLPPGVGTSELVGGAALAGIGFTVALFIADLSYVGTPLLAESKLAILAASVVATAIGVTVLSAARRSRVYAEE